MNIRKKLIDWLTPKEEKARQYQSYSDIVSSLYAAQGMGYNPETSYYDLVSRYASWVFTSVDKIQKTIAGSPKKIYAYKNKSNGKHVRSTEFKSYLRSSITQDERQKFLKEISRTTERVEIIDNPVVDLFNHPNHIDTPFIFWCDLMSRLELSGSCGIYKVPGVNGVPTELWVLPTSENGEFKPIPDSKLVISGYRYTDGNIQHTFKLDEAFWIHYPNPKDKFEGMSALKAQLDPYSIDYYLMRQQRNFFKNNAFVGTTLTTDHELKDHQVQELKELITSQFAGVANSGKPMVLHSGLKPDRLNNITTRDLMIEELGQIVKDKILSSYGINEGMVGLTANQNKANLDTSRENYLVECIAPRVQLLCECVERNVVDIFDDRMEFAIELPQIQQREIDIQERRANLDTATTTINEERAKMKMEAVPWGNEPWIPFNLTQYGIAKPKPQGQAEEGGAEPQKQFKDKMSDEAKTIQWKAFDEAAKEHEPLFSKIMIKIFQFQRDEVIDNLEREGVKIKGNIAGWGKQKIREWLPEHKDKTDKINIDKKAWIKKTAEALSPAYKQTIIDAGQNRIQQFSRKKENVTFNVDDPIVAKWIGTRMYIISKQITGTTFDDVEKVLKEGFEEGKPLLEISKELRRTFDVAETYRADLIARTEAASTYNEGDLDGAKQMEAPVKKFWINEPDARDTHQEAGKKYSEESAIDLDEDFEVGQDSMQAPGGGGEAGENINCRCTLGYVKA